eukprot:627435-Pyramimonas_sp.AAC.1
MESVTLPRQKSIYVLGVSGQGFLRKASCGRASTASTSAHRSTPLDKGEGERPNARRLAIVLLDV